MNKKTRELLIGLLILFLTVVVFFGFAELVSRLIYGSNLVYSYDGSTLWNLQPNQEGFTIPNGKFAHINSHGFRGEEFSVDKGGDIFRILMLGDSYVFGYGLSDNETLPFQLEELFNARVMGQEFEVLDAGVPGYGIFQMVNFYKETGKDYDADLIVLMSIESNLLRQPSDEERDVKGHLRNVVRFVLRKSTFAAVMKPRFERIRWVLFGDLGGQKEKYNKFWEYDKEMLNELASMLESQGKSLVLLPYIEDESELGFLEKMNDFADGDSNVFIIDNIYGALFNGSEDVSLLKIEGDGHPTAFANKITASLVYEKLINERLI